MILYKTGNILNSEAEALVNTVNCEGFMGKGLAYKFKKQFPNNNLDYIQACKEGHLRIGRLHYTQEKGKIIINFPTKDRWREKSKIEYVEQGLNELPDLIKRLSIKSIAIPPLGCGNGGLLWRDIRALIEKKLSSIAEQVDVFLYEPSKSFSDKSVAEPYLKEQAIMLMEMKQRLYRFDNVRLQSTAFFSGYFSQKKYFDFKCLNSQIVDPHISFLSKQIREFQTYHQTDTLEEAKNILYSKIISQSVEQKITKILPSIIKASNYVNNIDSNYELNYLTMISYFVDSNEVITKEKIMHEFREKINYPKELYPEKDIETGIIKLYNTGVIEKNMLGYFKSESA